MIDKFCAYLTKKIRKEMPEVDDERAEVIMYGLQNIIGKLTKGIIILIIASSWYLRLLVGVIFQSLS